MTALLKALDGQLYKALRIDSGLIKFLVRERLFGFDVASAPFFDSAEATNWFLGSLQRSRKYLEYGTGGSTYAAAKLGVPFIAVESDPYFLKSVRKKIQADGLARDTGQTYRYADVGVTGYVGQPLFHWRASPRRLEKFRSYSDPPPECYEGGQLPDLVLVDGRFRVACALKSLRMLQAERGWKIVFDDYTNRPGYHVVADFAQLDRTVGERIAVFTAAKNFSQNELSAAIRHYETVPD